DKSNNSAGDRTDSSAPGYNAGSSSQADGKSKSADGDQPLAGALAVTVRVETTKAYIAPKDASSVHTIDTGTGKQTIHAGEHNSTSAIADAGNVKFSPDAPTFAGASSVGGSLVHGKTYYYRVSALFASGTDTTVSGAGQDVSLGTLNVASTSGFGSTGRFTGTGITGSCAYTGTTGTSFTGITGCTGTPANGAGISQPDEGLPGAEATYAVPENGLSTNQVTVSWGPVANATGYRIYRGTATGEEKLLGTVAGPTSYHDNT